MKAIVVALVVLAAIPAYARISVSAGFAWDGDLSFHGRWAWMPDVGDVWVPRVHATWQPYLYGHWAWSPWGWMWMSSDPWGSVTYHYGRWLWTPHHGWVWVPGRVWSPAWVVWISGPGWIGWAPAAPDWCWGYWRHRDYHRHHGRWVMVGTHGFLSSSMAKERLPETKMKGDFTREFDRRHKQGPTLESPPERMKVERESGKIAAVVRERPVDSRGIDRIRLPERERGPVENPIRERKPHAEPIRDRERARDTAPIRDAESIHDPARTRDAEPSRERGSIEPERRSGDSGPRSPAVSPAPQPRGDDRGRERAATPPQPSRGPAAPSRSPAGTYERSKAHEAQEHSRGRSRR